jgi:hypothetical protein
MVRWMGIPFAGFRQSRRSFQEARNTGSSEPSSKKSDAFGGSAAIPITPEPHQRAPNKSILMIGERGAGKDKREAAIRVWDDREFCGRVPRHNCDPTLPPTSGSKARSLRASFRLPCQSRAMLIAARSRSRTGTFAATSMRKSRIPGTAQSPPVSESLHTTGVVI